MLLFSNCVRYPTEYNINLSFGMLEVVLFNCWLLRLVLLLIGLAFAFVLIIVLESPLGVKPAPSELFALQGCVLPIWVERTLLGQQIIEGLRRLLESLLGLLCGCDHVVGTMLSVELLVALVSTLLVVSSILSRGEAFFGMLLGLDDDFYGCVEL